MMMQIEAEPGMHIKAAAVRLVEAAKVYGDAFLIFNEECVTANQFSTVNGVCADYERASKLRQKAYRASPEGKKAKAQQVADTKRLQAAADELMAILPKLDFGNVGNLLWWLCEIEPARDRVGVKVDNEKITKTFAHHGYTPNMHVHPDFNENDREIYARWIIGQSLGDAFCARTRMMTEQWKRRFAK